MPGAEHRLDQGYQHGLGISAGFSEEVRGKPKSGESEGVIEDWEENRGFQAEERHVQRP